MILKNKTNNKIKIISLTCCKNEEDIIESFVRMNKNIIDLFIFVDDSSDRTTHILESLTLEGFPIRVLEMDRDSTEYRQSDILSEVRESLIKEFPDSIFLPLDCDEFPEYSRAELLDTIARAPRGQILLTAWKTYVPLTNNFPFDAQLSNGFALREPEGTQYYKIVIPNSLDSSIIICEGAHDATLENGGQIPHVSTSLKLAHFPVRSSSQIIKKNLAAVIKQGRAKRKKSGEGYHIYPVFNTLVMRDFTLTLGDLQGIALRYANSAVKCCMNYNLKPPLQDCEIRYTRKNTDSLVEFLVREIVALLLEPIPSDLATQLRSILLMQHEKR